MAKNTPDTKSLVESVIDSMLTQKLDAKTAMQSLVAPKQNSDVVSFEEGEDVSCPTCGGQDFEEGFVESEQGEVSALRCKSCETILESIADEQEASEDGLVEAEIDEDNPACPVCGSDDLSGDMVESDGEENLVIHCGGCNARMVAV